MVWKQPRAPKPAEDQDLDGPVLQFVDLQNMMRRYMDMPHPDPRPVVSSGMARAMGAWAAGDRSRVWEWADEETALPQVPGPDPSTNPSPGPPSPPAQGTSTRESPLEPGAYRYAVNYINWSDATMGVSQFQAGAQAAPLDPYFTESHGGPPGTCPTCWGGPRYCMCRAMRPANPRG